MIREDSSAQLKPTIDREVACVICEIRCNVRDTKERNVIKAVFGLISTGRAEPSYQAHLYVYSQSRSDVTDIQLKGQVRYGYSCKMIVMMIKSNTHHLQET